MSDLKACYEKISGRNPYSLTLVKEVETMRIIAACLTLLLLLAAPSLAERYAYGGTGEEALLEAVSLRDGLFAVGTTASADGDLAGRTRSGESGWALRIGEYGQRLWDFCSAKSGMMIMCAPHAYADGTFSLVLTDEDGQRGEWIELNDRGRQRARVAIPQTLCAEDRTARIIAMTACEGEKGRYLALLLEHAGSGALCCTALSQDGGTCGCGTFYGDAQGVLLADDADGRVLHLGAELGTLAVTRLCPGVPPQTHTFSLPGDGVGIACVSDALIAADGSLALCGQSVTADQKSGGFLMRLSAEEEVLFALTLEDHPMPAHLTETDTGYAVYADGALLLFDEDGAPLGETEAGETPLDLTSLNGQAALLTHEGERRAKQAVLHTVESAGRVELPEEDAAPETHATPVPQKEYIVLDGEKLICSDGGAGGVTVSLVDAQGRTRFTTRTPIHTAADRLVWESASRTEDGGIRLSGYYETDGADGPSRQRATALLGADGVLRELRAED